MDVNRCPTADLVDGYAADPDFDVPWRGVEGFAMRSW